MSDQSSSSHLQMLFEAALQDYEKQTGIELANHPLANRLQNCDTVESVTAVLREQTQGFSESLEKDKVFKLLKKAVPVLRRLSSAVNFGRTIGLVRPFGADCVFNVPDPHHIAFPACDSNTHKPRCPTLCTSLSLVPKRASS